MSLKLFVFNLSVYFTARAVVKPLKFPHNTPILTSLHWLKINEIIQFKVISLSLSLSLSLSHKSRKTGQPSYLRSLLSFLSHRSNRSSPLITLSRPFLTSRLKIANGSSITPLLLCGTVSHLIYATYLITSLLHLY